ncbi:Patatin-like phospholipase domain-containing protein [Mycena indigotica]|uniref:Patatin-like phospholipase domain-containing protein n=1 Tax=Mycena indigotica TaxID=2126181 RepID=A0A8H6SN33_9AGAR|nr:Patatin-like phospholipase domain-containing protein [Mycena indigotica]KAF7301676.1 Patatin-like phospholipase domain-containing protein [Mycena indigotica]
MPPPLEEDFVDETHIHAFKEALEYDGEDHINSPILLDPEAGRVRKISALSDFAPVNLRVKRRKRKEHRKAAKHDWSFIIFRWPLLGFIFLFIAAEFGLYVFLRQLVNVKEWVSAWRGRKGLLRKKLRGAATYEEWKEAAGVMDEYLQFDEWKKDDEDAFYDYKLLRRVHKSLKTLREKNDVRGCLGVLATCLRSNFAAVESPRLYSETFFGTKDLIEAYFDEQERAIELIRNSSELTLDEKRRFFKAANTNLGISALCLSGGASFGYYHTGVVKAFLDNGLLPRVITGTSAGGLIAALCCTRTDAELKELLVPQLADKITACEESFSVWGRRLWKTGARFDPLLWARKCAFFTRGSLTFKEAYMRTGRILNISVIPADRHSPTRLLNYLTSPDTLIWSALLASAAVPGILPSLCLMQKLRDGSAVPYNWGSRFKDGSLRVDIPLQALHTYFNVTFPVVSQVNPHVHLFFFAPRGSPGRPVAHRKGKGWRGNFILSAAEQWLKHELTKNFKVIRDLELLPQLLGQDWSSVFLQRFDGHVTIWPRTRLYDWLRILSDPSQHELERMMRVGQLATWPKLHMIANRARIEKQIYLGRQHIRQIAKSKPTDLTPELTSPPPSGSDHPLSVDTDAESAFTHKSRTFYRNKRSGTSAPREHSRHPDLLRNRKRWASSEKYEPASPSGFLARLRARSFSSFKGSALKEVNVAPEDGWSSDTDSSEEELIETTMSSEDMLRAVERRLQQQQQQASPPDIVQFTGQDYELKMKLRRMIDPGILRNPDAQAVTSMKLLLRLCDNIIAEPENKKWHSFKPTNSIIKRDLMDPKGTVEYARELGFSPHVEDYQPVYVFNPKKLHQLKIGAELLRETLALKTEKQERELQARKNEKAVASAAAEKVRLAFEDDRKRKQLNDTLERERRAARLEAAAQRAEQQALEREEEEQQDQDDDDGDDDRDEDDEEQQLMPGGGNVLGEKPRASIPSNKKTD